jgi:uncharacterized YigZ family protein
MRIRYSIPAREIRHETTAGNSRFVCTVAEARTVDDAQSFIRRVKGELLDASSHAYAYRIGFGASVTDGCNDGGEPGGTAGRPMLAVLQGSGLGDVAAVVSRYFGGTRLGTGGLVRAFAGALKSALEQLPRVERVERKTFLLELPYPMYEPVKRLARTHRGELDGEEFGATVLITLTFIVDDVEPFQRALADLSAGQLRMIDAR